MSKENGRNIFKGFVPKQCSQAGILPSGNYPKKNRGALSAAVGGIQEDYFLSAGTG
jgi:hypothetical protein